MGKSNTKVGIFLDVPTWERALPMLVNLKIVQHCRDLKIIKIIKNNFPTLESALPRLDFFARGSTLQGKIVTNVGYS